MTLDHKAFLKLLGGLLLLAIAVFGSFLFLGWPTRTEKPSFGMTFSRPYAEELGLDPDEVLKVALDDLGIRRFRIPAYWKLVEPEEGKWDFLAVDKQIFEIGKRGGKVVLAIGEKQPRWPECWGPEWWKKLPREEQRVKTLKFLETIVTRYRNNPTVLAWQVENEPFFAYGDCPRPDVEFVSREAGLVKGLDPTREVWTTDSGELSTWTTVGSSVDRLGVSVYRVVRNPILGNFNWHYFFLPPYSYYRKGLVAKAFGVKDVYVSEFQMEPWSNRSLQETPIEDQLSTMNLTQMKKNFAFAERMQFSAIDFWGIEWWIWMERKGHPEFLEAAKTFWKEHR